MNLKITHESTADPAVIKEIEQSLRAYNFATAGAYNPEILLLTARDDENNLQAGFKGVMSSKWLFIDTLWVAEPYRHKGYGSPQAGSLSWRWIFQLAIFRIKKPQP